MVTQGKLQEAVACYRKAIAMKAVDLLRRGQAKKDAVQLAHWKTDSDLDSLRQREDFKKLLVEPELAKPER